MQNDWRIVEPRQDIPLKWLRNKGTEVDRWSTMSGEIGYRVVEDVDGNFWMYGDWVTDSTATLVERVTTE